MNLIYKIQIKGAITLETGMHIGGSEVELEIGGIDKAVVKDRKTKKPYIPGSSLKGKLRDLIARKLGYQKIEEFWMKLSFYLAMEQKANFGTPAI